jgi:hypothetical protein
MQPILAQSLAHVNMSQNGDKEGLVYDVWKWITTCITQSMKLVGTAARTLGADFFRACDVQTLIGQLVAHCDYASHRHLAQLHEEILAPMCAHCPPNYHQTHLLPFAKQLLLRVSPRLTEAWDAQQRQESGKVAPAGVSGETAEILDDIQMRELTRTFLSTWMRAVRGRQPAGLYKGKGRGGSIPRPPPSPKRGGGEDDASAVVAEISPFGLFLVSCPELVEPLLRVVRASVAWPDSNVRRKAVLLCIALLPRLADQPAFHPLAGEVLRTVLAVLTMMDKTALDVAAGGGDSDLTGLAKIIYQSFGRFSSTPRDIFLTVVAEEYQGELRNLEELLFDPGAEDRAQRKAMKSFLEERVIGRRLGV